MENLNTKTAEEVSIEEQTIFDNADNLLLAEKTCSDDLETLLSETQNILLIQNKSDCNTSTLTIKHRKYSNNGQEEPFAVQWYKMPSKMIMYELGLFLLEAISTGMNASTNSLITLINYMAFRS